MIAPGFTGGRLDRADQLRQDPAALAAARADPAARMLVLDADLLPEADGGRLAWLPLAGERELILLGLLDGAPCFVALADPADALQPAMRVPGLMELVSALPAGEAATYAAARSLVAWHARHRFCANCGAGTAPFRGGWGRACPACGAEHFPRIDPVVIMLAEHDGRALVGRGRNWPAGRYSALAGFVEPGESIEEAVAREIAEETGVRVGNVRYLASQPWPFPSQLMIACIAEAADTALAVDESELEAAMWVTRAEVCAALAGDAARFDAPPRYAIAHTLLTAWAEA